MSTPRLTSGAIPICVVVGLMILAISLIARSQLGGMAHEQRPIADADAAVLDSLEPLRETDRDERGGERDQ
jgi:hypothetical protein